ncbi:pantoate--beta-alanine ligase [Spiractinospora alimapuensis]|uniref:pantoate--beta-alanine ligase n=1 Tax=Spiractinospora alimapuensis TaxID=2820884 RepID=UPI001EEB1FC6|nr:pantoate--beta-alanine ligase [Spiractinospora alimapuensis]QVQ50960.1 pantoate--beta-alanine ligase [Spiractinospora alimapuensis]
MSQPRLFTTRAEVTHARSDAGRVALVPTMGALHEGHRALMARARQREDVDSVWVSVFVNPLQFGPTEDFDRYPRDLDADLAVCEEEGVSAVFAPSTTEMYPLGRPMVTVRAGAMGDLLEGESRPGFFDGVLTVVTKLFAILTPDIAVFGEKDAQQLAMVRRLVADLSLPPEILGVPTRRDSDGLAISSRNVYLSTAERHTALRLSQGLRAAEAARAGGAGAVRKAAHQELDAGTSDHPPLRLDYLALVDPDTFSEVEDGYSGPAVLAVAAWVGTTRLIDNVRVTL